MTWRIEFFWRQKTIQRFFSKLKTLRLDLFLLKKKLTLRIDPLLLITFSFFWIRLRELNIFFVNMSQRIFLKKNVTQRIETFLVWLWNWTFFFRRRLKELNLFLIRLIVFFCKRNNDSQNWPFFFSKKKKNSKNWTFFFKCETKKIEPFFSNVTRRIESFSSRLTELNPFFLVRLWELNTFLNTTQRIEFISYDSKNWTSFSNVTQKIEPFLFFAYDLKNWTFFFFFWTWLKVFFKKKLWLKDSKLFSITLELNFFFYKKRLKVMIFQKYDSKNCNFFFELRTQRIEISLSVTLWIDPLENMTQRLEFFLNMTQRLEPFFLIPLKDLNPFCFNKKCNSKNWTFFFGWKSLTDLNLLLSWLEELNFFFFWIWLKELNLFLIRLKELNLFLVRLKDMNLFCWYHSKNWTLFLVTQTLDFFEWL